MAKVRDHYFEVRPDGTYIYLGSTNPEAISRRDEADMFFANGIDNPVCVIRGAMATIQPPQPQPEEEPGTICSRCGHPLTWHATADNAPNGGVTCAEPGCRCEVFGIAAAEAAQPSGHFEDLGGPYDPESTNAETCPDCGHAVSLHTDGGHSGYTCQSPQCICSTPAWYLHGDDLAV